MYDRFFRVKLWDVLPEYGVDGSMLLGSRHQVIVFLLRILYPSRRRYIKTVHRGMDSDKEWTQIRHHYSIYSV